MRRLQAQLDNLETAVNLALVTRYAELSQRPPRDPTQGPSDLPLNRASVLALLSHAETESGQIFVMR